MRNFIPVAFTEEEEVACPVCVVRVDLEQCLDEEFKAFRELLVEALSEKSLSAELAEELMKVYEEFNTFYSDYRISFVVNLCIWFAAERFGNASKIADVLAAYEEYKFEAKNSFQQLDSSIVSLLASLVDTEVSVDSLWQAHEAMRVAHADFWKEVDPWTDGRKTSSFRFV